MGSQGPWKCDMKGEPESLGAIDHGLDDFAAPGKANPEVSCTTPEPGWQKNARRACRSDRRTRPGNAPPDIHEGDAQETVVRSMDQEFATGQLQVPP